MTPEIQLIAPMHSSLRAGSIVWSFRYHWFRVSALQANVNKLFSFKHEPNYWWLPVVRFMFETKWLICLKSRSTEPMVAKWPCCFKTFSSKDVYIYTYIYIYIQFSVVIRRPIIVTYYINNYKNRCCIIRHPIPRPLGVFCEYLWEH